MIGETLATLARHGAPATWVLSNHDVVRPGHQVRPVRHVLGQRRPQGRHAVRPGARGAPRPGGGHARDGAARVGYVYQGEELGLPEVEDLPGELRQDPMWKRSGQTVPGRDGCRVPIPWSGLAPPFGNGTGEPWLPQPASWRALTVEAQSCDPGSMLAL